MVEQWLKLAVLGLMNPTLCVCVALAKYQFTLLLL